MQLGVTECFWSDTFHEARAPDMGYITYCNSDFAMFCTCNTDMKPNPTRALLEGQGRCNHCFDLEG